MARHAFSQFFSLDSPKAIKARKFGWMNAINYMAPADTGGVGNLCPWASSGCKALCLGEHSGQAAMVSKSTGTNAVRESRKAKAVMFMRDRSTFMAELDAGIARAQRKADREGLRLCVRLNGATDINWLATIAQYPTLQFVDYTKSVNRALAAAAGKLPANYSVTFSRTEGNDNDCVRVLEAGGNVAVVASGARPATWLGFRTIDGDEHDLRHLDPRQVVVWLSPKGNKAKRDTSGFVLREAA
jgi:hypothetical protein